MRKRSERSSNTPGESSTAPSCIGRKSKGICYLKSHQNGKPTLFDFADLPDRTRFWDRAEQEILEALRVYAEQAEDTQATQKRLFAQDAAKGFAFIDVCQRRYDVSVMNPPFGEASKRSKAYIEIAHARTKNDVYAAFVGRGLSLLKPRGMLGAITSRTGFFLSSFQKWREEEILLQEARPTVFADLGHGVLDTAMEETAAYCLEAVEREGIFVSRTLDYPQVTEELLQDVVRRLLAVGAPVQNRLVWLTCQGGC